MTIGHLLEVYQEFIEEIRKTTPNIQTRSEYLRRFQDMLPSIDAVKDKVYGFRQGNCYWTFRDGKHQVVTLENLYSRLPHDPNPNWEVITEDGDPIDCYKDQLFMSKEECLKANTPQPSYAVQSFPQGMIDMKFDSLEVSRKFSNGLKMFGINTTIINLEDHTIVPND